MRSNPSKENRMSDVAVEAALSAAQISHSEPIEIPRAGTQEYAEWRLSGTLPDKPKPAETAPADKLKEATSDTATAPEPVKQETKPESRRKPDAEARIRELTEESRRLRAELDEARKPKKTEAESSPARQPEARSSQRSTTRTPMEPRSTILTRNSPRNWPIGR